MWGRSGCHLRLHVAGYPTSRSRREVVLHLDIMACLTSLSCTPSHHKCLVSTRAPPEGSLLSVPRIHTTARESQRSSVFHGHCSLSLTPWRSAVSDPRRSRGNQEKHFHRDLLASLFDRHRRSYRPRNPVIYSVRTLASFDFATATCSRSTFRTGVPGFNAPQACS